MTRADLPDPVIGGADAANDRASISLARVGDLLDRLEPPSGPSGRRPVQGVEAEPAVVLEEVHDELTRVLGTTAPSPRTGRQ